MTVCGHCGDKIDGLPFRCRRCHTSFCHRCRLPEEHECPGLRRGNIYKKLHRQRKRHRVHISPQQHRHESPQSPPTIQTRLVRKYRRAVGWLKHKRHHRHYWKLTLKNIGIAVALLLVLGIVFTNIHTLNSIVLWFIPLGGLALLVTLFFFIKYTWRSFKGLRIWFDGTANGIRVVMFIVLALILVFAWQSRDNLFDSVAERWAAADIESLFPIGISDDISPDSPFSKQSVTNAIDSASQKLSEIASVEPISEKTMAVEQAILKYTNAERKNHGLRELRWDSQLAEIAREHSKDMVDNDYFSHDNLRGEDPTARARKHGYSTTKSLGGGWTSHGIAENIGKMPTGSVQGVGYVGSDADSIAMAQVESWMDSPGHRQNILTSDYDRLGVGVAYDGLYYVSTQNFR